MARNRFMERRRSSTLTMSWIIGYCRHCNECWNGRSSQKKVDGLDVLRRQKLKMEKALRGYRRIVHDEAYLSEYVEYIYCNELLGQFFSGNVRNPFIYTL